MTEGEKRLPYVVVLSLLNIQKFDLHDTHALRVVNKEFEHNIKYKNQFSIKTVSVRIHSDLKCVDLSCLHETFDCGQFFTMPFTVSMAMPRQACQTGTDRKILRSAPSTVKGKSS
jgi:hypothetical protein